MEISGAGGGNSDQTRARREATAALREAQAAVQEAQSQVRDAQREAQTRIDGIRDEYIHQSEVETSRQEASYENLKNKGYEQLRELQRDQQSEINKTRRQGEQALAQAQSYYRDTIYNTEKRGREDIQKLQAGFQAEQEHAVKTARLNQEASLSDRALQINAIQDQTKMMVDEVQRNSQEDYARNKALADSQAEKSNAHLQETYQGTLKRHQETLDRVNRLTTQEMNEVRADTARKLSAYKSRQDDPFYQLLDINAEFEEAEDAFILTARVPEHEQKNVSVSIRGEEVIVSGYRRNQEKLDLGPGRAKTTASHQTFSESFPLSFPVDPKGVTRETQGDTLTIRIPKKTGYSPPTRQKKNSPPKLRADRPQFPENLPGISDSDQRKIPGSVRAEDRLPPKDRPLS